MALARTYSTMLNSIGESRHPCLVPDLSGKVFSLLPLNKMLAVYFSTDALYQFEEVPFYSQFVKSYYQKWMFDFCQFFSASIEMFMWLFFTSLLLCVLH